MKIINIIILSLIFTSSIAPLNLKAQDAKDSLLELRSKRRLIEPNTHIITLAISSNIYPLQINEPSLLLPSEINRSLTGPFARFFDGFYINYQYALKNNFFIESGFKYLQYWTSFKTNEWLTKYYYNFSGFSTLSFSLGGGYRIVGSNNLRFFDIHAGLSLGVTDNPVGTGQYFSESTEYIDGNGDYGVLNYSWDYQITSRYSLGFYLGVSKDIRITKNLFLTARYHYQFGKNSQLTDHRISYNIPTLDITNTVKASNTAKGQMIALGLRWFFDK